MALRAAVANGNWSSTSTWNGGVIPSAGDIVASNGFTVTIDVNVNVDSITNTSVAPISAIPTMTSDTAPSGIITYSSQYDLTNYPARFAFDNNVSTNWIAQDQVLTGFLAYQFTSPKIITLYTISGTFTPGAFPKNWTFEGWNGSSWIILDTVVGNTNTSSYTGTLSNTTAYIKYRINVTLNNVSTAYLSIGQFSMFEGASYLSTTTAGGTFNLNSGVTVTCTNIGDGISSAVGACVTYSGVGTSTINANILGSTIGTPGCIGVRVTGTGILNINGNLVGFRTSSGNNIRALSIEANGTVNLTGNISVPNQFVVYISSQCTFNIVGNVYVGTYNTTTTVYCVGTNAVINLTGNVYGQGGTGGWSMTGIYLGVVCTLNITGNLIGLNNDSRFHALVSVAANATITVVGTMQSGTNGITDFGEICFSSNSNSYLSHIGSVIASRSGYALYSTGSGAINLMTGPFISSDSGMQPIYVSRMHYRRTIGSYYEFRDNSTNGALPPAGAAPATRLVSPDTVVAAPIPANVRQGVTYALGSQTGTMIVPDPANVVKNVPVDNTVGTGVLDPSAMWNVPLAYINTSNSIGKRVKNASTVESTGAQIQTTLNNNP